MLDGEVDVKVVVVVVVVVGLVVIALVVVVAQVVVGVLISFVIIVVVAAWGISDALHETSERVCRRAVSSLAKWKPTSDVSDAILPGMF